MKSDEALIKNYKFKKLLFGDEYLERIKRQEEKCHFETKNIIKSFSPELPDLEKNVGTILSLLESVACCGWGCAEKGHIIESLMGRVYGLGSGAYRLMNFGRYDEALLLIRSIGEIANLLALFAISSSSLEKWLAEDEKTRNKNFSPVKVRLLLEKNNVQLPMAEARYKYLSSLTAHPTPSIKPGMHNPKNISVLGGHTQVIGIIFVLHELAHVLGCSAVICVRLLEIPTQVKDEIHSLGESLLSKSILWTPEDFAQLSGN